jgi:hypothetical protein
MLTTSFKKLVKQEERLSSLLKQEVANHNLLTFLKILKLFLVDWLASK